MPTTGRRRLPAGIKAESFDKNYLHANGIVTDDRAFIGSHREVGSIVNELSRTFLKDFADQHGTPLN